MIREAEDERTSQGSTVGSVLRGPLQAREMRKPAALESRSWEAGGWVGVGRGQGSAAEKER